MLKFLSVPLALAAFPAVAQPTGDDIVVTAARAPQDAREVGQAITVVDRAEIDARQAMSVADLLATTPGVTVTRNGGLGSFTGLRIRGAEAEQTLVVIDGVRVNDPSSPGGGFDFANLLAGSVDRIEVLRGPNAVPWGSQALGGVVNIVTAAAPQDGVRVRGRAEYGYADTVYGSAGIAGASGAFTGALDAGYLRTDGISAAASGNERDGYRQYGATGRVGVAVALGVSLDLRGYWADSRVELDGFPAPAYTFADTDDYSTTQELYGYAGLNVQLGRLGNRLAFTIADVNRDNYEPAFGTEPSFIGRGRSERYEYQADFRPLDALRLVGGVEREDTRYADGFDRFSTGVWSAWGEAIVKPVAPLTLTAGVRHDDHDAYGGKTTFGADAAFALASGTVLRASYGEGFKAPTLYQLYSAYGARGLAPETARNVDVGIEQAFAGGKARITATYFNRRTRNQIDFRSCVGAECASRPFGLYDNIRRTAAQGAELSIALRPVEALTFSASFSYIDSENRSPGANFGKDLARRPHNSVSAKVDWRSPLGVSLGATVTHVSDSFDDAGNFVRLDGYALAGLRAELPIGRRVALYGRIDNLFDENYQVVSGYGTYGRAAYGGIRVTLD